MTSAESLGILDELLDLEANRRVVRGNHRPSADADDAVDRNAAADERTEHSDVRGSSETTCAEHDRDSYAIL